MLFQLLLVLLLCEQIDANYVAVAVRAVAVGDVAVGAVAVSDVAVGAVAVSDDAVGAVAVSDVL